MNRTPTVGTTDTSPTEKTAFDCSALVLSRLASAADALHKLSNAYELTGAESLARETRSIVQVMTARASVLSGGATQNAKLRDDDEQPAPPIL